MKNIPVLCVLGKSGVGKTSHADRFVLNHPDYVMVDSYCSRPIRPSEQEKVNKGEQCGHLFCKWTGQVEPLNDVYKQYFTMEDGTVRNFKDNEITAHAYIVDKETGEGHHYFSLNEQFNPEFYGRDDVKGILYTVDMDGLTDMYRTMDGYDIRVIALIADKQTRKDRLMQRFPIFTTKKELDEAKAWRSGRMKRDDEQFALVYSDITVDVNAPLMQSYKRFCKAVEMVMIKPK